MTELERIKQKMINAVSEQMHDLSTVDSKELGEVVDIIKDLSEAEYYCKVVKAMAESEEDDMLGYREPKRRIPRKPYIDQEPYIDSYLKYDTFGPMSDYMDGAGISEPRRRLGNRMPNEDYKHGEAYGKYINSRRAYTETSALKDKDDMNRHAREHVNDVILTMTEIWQASEPELKRQMKMDLQALLNKMQV